MLATYPIEPEAPLPGLGEGFGVRAIVKPST